MSGTNSHAPALFGTSEAKLDPSSRHPDVDYRDIGIVLCHGGEQCIAVSDCGTYVVATVAEQLGEPPRIMAASSAITTRMGGMLSRA